MCLMVALESVIKNKRLYAGWAMASLVPPLLLLLLFVPAPSVAGTELAEVLQRQSEVRSVSASFVQRKHSAMLARPITSEGRFFFKRGKGVRWEYEDVLVVYDGTHVFIHTPEVGEAEKISGAEKFLGPLTFDLRQLEQQYEVTGSRADGLITLDLRPRRPMPFNLMQLVFPPGSAFPESVRVTEETGDVTAIGFSNIKINGRLKDGLFVFRPPPGTKVRESRIE